MAYGQVLGPRRDGKLRSIKGRIGVGEHYRMRTDGGYKAQPVAATAQTPEERASKIALLIRQRYGDSVPSEIIVRIEGMLSAELSSADASARLVTLQRCRGDLAAAVLKGVNYKCLDGDRVRERVRVVDGQWERHSRRWVGLL